MEPGTITLDREAFKALASEVRVAILKHLEERRMTVTDLSNAMDLAKPTLLEHLDRLVAADLVRKVDEGRKWIYYELSKRGRSVLHPHEVNILISLGVFVLLVAGGIVGIVAAATAPATAPLLGEAMPDSAWSRLTGGESFEDAIAGGAPGPWGLLLLALASLPLISAWLYRRAERDLVLTGIRPTS